MTDDRCAVCTAPGAHWCLAPAVWVCDLCSALEHEVTSALQRRVDGLKVALERHCDLADEILAELDRLQAMRAHWLQAVGQPMPRR